MKTKEVTVVFEYTNQETLKNQIDYLYSYLSEGFEYKEEVRYMYGNKFHIQFQQKYKRMRNFKIVNNDSVIIKSAI
jgi:hypothetical protein